MTLAARERWLTAERTAHQSSNLRVGIVIDYMRPLIIGIEVMADALFRSYVESSVLLSHHIGLVWNASSLLLQLQRLACATGRAVPRHAL